MYINFNRRGSSITVDQRLIPDSENPASSKAVLEGLSTKVDVVPNKGLSSNDFTDELKEKLDSIEFGAQTNVNADWNSNSGKSKILNKPDLSAFVTKSVNDLLYYYLKSEVYNKTESYSKLEIDSLLSPISQLEESVQRLWLRVDSRGDSVSRPVLTASDKGFQYYDLDLRIPIWWSGSAWTDASGNIV